MIKGIDLSEWNENVDYEGLKASGIEFALLRIGYGKDEEQMDCMFDEHYRGCKKAGIKVGAYHYSYCNRMENAEKEAQNCINYLTGYKLDLPVFYDLEDNTILSSGVDVTEIAQIFCDKLSKAGYDAGVYANLNWFRNYISPYALINDGYFIWLAQWNDEITADFEVDIWQYTNNIFDTESNRIDGNYLLNTNLIDIEPSPEFEVDICKSLAVDVIFGRYGNGEERKQALGEYYEEVQNIVNDMYNIIGG